MNTQLKLVYQAYGRQDIIDQVLFSVSSLFSHYQDTAPFRVEIYTDKPESLREFFADAPQVDIVPIATADIRIWRGEIDFVHRVKLKILEMAASKSAGPLVYLDGDTYFTRAPDALFGKIDERNSLMHVKESSLGTAKDILTKKIAKFVKSRMFHVMGHDLKIPPTTEMWNAGVIGLSKKNTELFPQMVELTDVMYGEYKKHVMEQLAVSYFVQMSTVIHPADQDIIHYWPNKEGFDKAIAEYLGRLKSFAATRANMASFNWPPPPVPKKKKRWFFF